MNPACSNQKKCIKIKAEKADAHVKTDSSKVSRWHVSPCCHNVLEPLKNYTLMYVISWQHHVATHCRPYLLHCRPYLLQIHRYQKLSSLICVGWTSQFFHIGKKPRVSSAILSTLEWTWAPRGHTLNSHSAFAHIMHSWTCTLVRHLWHGCTLQTNWSHRWKFLHA